MEDTYNNRRNTTVNGESRIQYIPQEDVRYPARLRVLPGMPKGIYVLGRLPDDNRPSVAIVGARSSSAYGDGTARLFAGELAKAGVQIISGMAWGIDGKAHEGALERGGDTYAVLGSGVDVCYPAGHRRLYEKIPKNGGVLSEQPPGMPPKPGHFPARNRIISGLADLVLVVEARERSGSLITADLALEQGKDVFAVPGRLDDELSRGCLNLLKQGAGLADRPETTLECLGICPELKAEEVNEKKILLAKDENIVYSLIRLQPVRLEELTENTGFSVQKMMTVLVGLQLKGCIREVQKNYYVRTNSRIIDGEVSSDCGVTCEGKDH